MPLGIGDSAPDFVFNDATGQERAFADFHATPAILLLTPGSRSAEQPALQHLTFRGESIPVMAPADERTARAYGVGDDAAVFVISGGKILWSHTLGDARTQPRPPASAHLTRREFLAVLAAASIAATVWSPADGTVRAAAVSDNAVDVTLTVNGRPTHLSIDPRVTLLDALRESLHLTGSKKGCDHGQCGACTVHVDGRRVLSCLTLAVSAHGASVTTIEGLADGDRLHPVQQAFIEEDGFQCGYCTSGQIMSAVALLTEPCGPADDDVRECMSGNICRCGAYPGIVAAIQSVRKRS